MGREPLSIGALNLEADRGVERDRRGVDRRGQAAHGRDPAYAGLPGEAIVQLAAEPAASPVWTYADEVHVGLAGMVGRVEPDEEPGQGAVSVLGSERRRGEVLEDSDGTSASIRRPPHQESTTVTIRGWTEARGARMLTAASSEMKA